MHDFKLMCLNVNTSHITRKSVYIFAQENVLKIKSKITELYFIQKIFDLCSLEHNLSLDFLQKGPKGRINSTLKQCVLLIE